MRTFSARAILLACALPLLYGGVSVHAQVFSLDAITSGANGFFPDDLVLPGPAPRLPGAGGLPGGPPPPPPPIDVNAFSFTKLFPAGAHTLVGAEFSVAPGSVGARGTAVGLESGGLGFLDESADIFGTGFAGGNILVWDGDGIPAPGIPAFGPLGIVEPPVAASNVDGWDAGPPFGPPAAPGIVYSITAGAAAAHPVYAGTGATGGYLFFSPPVVGYSVFPALYATDVMLGLGPADDIDAVAIIDDGTGGPSPGNTIYFSLTPGSPTLGLLGASAADILVTSIGGAPGIAAPAATIGLLGTDDLNALDVFAIPEPASLAAMCLAAPLLLRRRRR